MELRFEEHCTDDGLELYALGRLEESCLGKVEGHLLLCGSCRERLDEADIFVRAMKSAAARLRRDEQAHSFMARLRQVFQLPAFPVWAAGGVCALVLAVSAIGLRQPAPNNAAAEVSLRADRGVANTVPAHRKLSVSLDARGLATGGSARVVLVNTKGAILEQADEPVAKDRIRAHFSTVLDQGDYFVRLYVAGNHDAVREFALEAQ